MLQKRHGINVNKQKRAKVARGPRHGIPAGGLQFANHAELRAHFSGRPLEDLANINKKTKRTQDKVKELEENITELVVKLHKHSERHAAGKFPATIAIEKDIGKERAKLDELRARLRRI